MDKESIYLLDRIDCNCNSCGFMKRDLEKFNSYNDLYKNTNPSWRIHYGHCLKFDKPVSFIPNSCQLDTQKCFIHRKDYVHE
jgi:hypothetical protein